jgi:predicted lipid-binding transport protein (Tim44 family)
MAAMGDNLQVLEILVFAVIAGILVFRLRSVLGRRTGTERRRDLPLSRSAPPANPAPPVNPAPPAAANAAPPMLPSNTDVTDSEFDSASFLTGARGAFQIIVEAFAAGDRAKLQPLLSPDVFRSFGDAITARERAKERQETKIVALKSTDIVQNRLEGGTALVTVKFVSDQILVTRDAAGAVVDGDPDHAVEHTDLWTFSRPTRSPDPNWILIATETPPPA